MDSPRRSPPPPLEGNDRLVTAAITAGWVVALVVLLVVRNQLPADQRWWVWTCVAGVVQGVFGFWYVPWLKQSRVKAAERRAGGRRDDDHAPDEVVSYRHGEPPECQVTGGPVPAWPTQVPGENGSKTVSSTDTPGRSTRS